MASHRIYRYTSIGRPLYPEVPSNRAVLILFGPTALLGALKSYLDGGDALAIALGAAVFALALFGAWALGRELHPDDNSAAFVAMACAGLVAWFGEDPGLFTLFVTLALVRVVNRTTGVAAKQSDSILVLLGVFGVIYVTESPFFGLVGALAFALDGSLREPLRRHWLYALICFGGTVVWLIDHDQGFPTPRAPAQLFEWLSVLFLLMFALNTWLLRKVGSPGDIGRQTLDLQRVRGGMAVALLAALQGMGQVPQVSLIIAVFAGISLDLAIRKGFHSPPGGS